jgi:hypothetical protein
MKKELLTKPLTVLVFAIALAFAGFDDLLTGKRVLRSAFAKSDRTDAAPRLFKGLFG